MADLVLEVQALRKAYGPRVALNNVSFTLERGQLAALLGPNGAGKSTLFQLLTGLFSADSGQLRILGQDLRRNPIPALAQLGVVFQQPTLDLDLSLWANLRFHAGLHGLSRAQLQARAYPALRSVGLLERIHEPVRRLSGGNRRKVELVRALLHQPALLLLDEPTVGLDPASRVQLLQQVRTLCREQGLSVLWATHLVDEAEQADQALILHRGQLFAHAQPQVLAQQFGASDLSSAFLAITQEHYT